jgi:hypothetical protein
VLSLPAKLRVLLNATFELYLGTKQSIVMREGTSRINNTNIGNAIYVSPKRIFAHDNVPMLEGQNGAGLLRSTDVGVVQVTPSSDVVTSDPYFLRAGSVTSDVGGYMPRRVAVDNPSQPQGHDCAITADGAYTCWVWEERTDVGSIVSAVRVVVVREADKTQVYNQLYWNTPLFVGGTATRSNPRVIWVNSPAPKFYVYCAVWNVGATQFYIENISLAAATDYAVASAESQVWASSVGVPVVGVLTADLPMFDADVGQDHTSIGIVARDNDAATTLEFMEVDSTDGVTITHNHRQNPGSPPDALTCLITNDGTDIRINGLYTTAGTAGSVLCSAMVFGTAAFTAAALAGSGPMSTGRIVAVDIFWGQPGSFQILFDGGSAGTFHIYETTLYSSSVDKALGSQIDVGSVLAGWLIHGRPVLGPGSLYYCTLMIPDPDGATVFLTPIDTFFFQGLGSACVLARIAAGEVGYVYDYFTTKMRVPALLPGAIPTKMTIPVQRWVQDLRLAGSAVITPLVQSRVDIDIDSQLGNLEIDGLNLLAGSCPQGYDGHAFNEALFHHPPVLWSATAVAGADNFTAGDHYVIYCEEWQDSQGRLHQGPPSTSKKITVAGANDSLSAVVTGTPSQKAGKQLVPYLTAAGAGAAGPFYRCYSPNGAGLTDTDLVKGDPLYTSGASGEELPNDPVPAHRQACVWQNRVWLSTGDGRIYYSKTLDPAFPPAFSAQFFRRVPTAFGRDVSIQPLGDRLLVICESKVGFIYGSGPTATGDADNYSEVLPLIENVGGVWAAPLSSIVAPEGVWFQSQFGLRLISGGGQLARDEDSDIGSELDPDISPGDTLTAVASPTKEQIRFYSSGAGCCFVWDQQWRQWSRFTFTTGAAPSACLANDTFYHLAADTFVYKEDSTVVTDNGTAYTAQIITNPIQLAGIQGFQRLYRMLLLGQGVPADVQTLTLQGAYDYDSVFSNLASSADITLNSSGVLQTELHFARQKCQSIALEINWKPKTSAYRMRLIDLALRVGVKRDHAKVPSSKRIS